MLAVTPLIKTVTAKIFIFQLLIDRLIVIYKLPQLTPNKQCFNA
jgi:hypothetical protein